jgi:predicted outer membrane repeat protein
MKTSERLRIAVAACALLAGMTAAAPGRITYVDDDASGANDGSSWSNAFVRLQGTLAVGAAGDEIRVAQGTYRPDADTPTAATDPNHVVFVDANATGANDGSSWKHAHHFLQDALADANSVSGPVEIRVAQGVYRPDQSSAHPGGTRDQNASFCLLDGVAIRGGFAGVGTPDPNARDVARYESVLSGDLAGNDIPVADPCDLLTEPTRLENSYTLVTAERGCSRSAILDGVTIRGAWDDALLLKPIPCRPSIRNCTFVGNSGGAGAAYVIEGTEPEFIACVFLRNAAWNHGGAIVVTWSHRGLEGYPTGNPFVVRGCVFAWNVVAGPDRDDPRVGGAVCLYSLGTPSVIEDCTFVGNSAEIGGAIYSYSYDKVNIVNCRFLQNTASQTGGAIYLQETNATVASCTFSGNTTPHGRACYVVGPQAWLSVTNTILWDGGGEISTSGQVQVNATYCDVAGGWVGPGNIDADPLFANPIPLDPNMAITPASSPLVFGDYHLKSEAGRWDPGAGDWVLDEVTGPCIDAGDPNSPVEDEPEPNGGRVNMGAYGGTAEASKSYRNEP